jgi:hypothetical protein
MYPNDLESLRPQAGLALEAVPETGAAVQEITRAHAVLVTTNAEIIRNNIARRNQQQLGVSIPDCEDAAWRRWQSTALRRFHEIRGAAAGKCLAPLDARVSAEAAELREREEGVARGLSGLAHDNQQTVRDLAEMLRRVTGGLPGDQRLRSARDAWHRLCRESLRLLAELPLPEPAKTPASAENETLKTLLTKEA